MPTPPSVTDTLRVRLIHALGSGNDAGSRFYVAYSGASPSAANCATFAAGVETAWAAHLASSFTANGDLTAVDVQDLNSTSGASGVWTGSSAGTRSGNVLPNQVCAIVEFGIARRYRGGKPKMYLPYGVESDTSAGAIDWLGSFTTGLASAWSSFVTAVLALGIGSASLTGQVSVGYYSGFTAIHNPVTGRYRNVPTYKSGPITPDPITSVGVRTMFGSQRRRRTATTP